MVASSPDEYANLRAEVARLKDELAESRKQAEVDTTLLRRLSSATGQAFVITAVDGAAASAAFAYQQNGQIVHANRPMLEMLGVECPEKLAGCSVLDVVVAEDVPIVKEAIAKVVEERAHGVRPQLSDGQRLSMVIDYADVDGPGVLVTIARDDTFEERLHTSESRFKHIFDHAPIGVVAFDTEGFVTHANPKAIQILGSPSVDATKRFCVFEFPPIVRAGLADVFKRVLKNGGTESGERSYESAWGRMFRSRYHISALTDSAGEVTGGQLIFEDVSEAHRLEQIRRALGERIRHGQKMRALAHLAGGVAHDMNNILGAIMGFALVMAEDLDETNPNMPDVEGIIKSSRRGRELIRRLFSFARRGDAITAPFDLNEAVFEAVEMLPADLVRNIGISTQLSREPIRFVGDLGQVTDAIVQLCLNACEAMSDGGELTVIVKPVRVEPELAAQHTSLSEGKWAVIDVLDSGPGMSEETQRRAFEPFYSTKEEMHGVGLGLPTVYGMVENHGGAVDLESDPAGTRVRIWLPLSSADPEPNV